MFSRKSSLSTIRKNHLITKRAQLRLLRRKEFKNVLRLWKRTCRKKLGDDWPSEGEDEMEEVRRGQRDAAAEIQLEALRDGTEADVVGRQHRQLILGCRGESGGRLPRHVSGRHRHRGPLEARRRSRWPRSRHCSSA